MKYSIALRNLPFEPDDKQVIYVENQYDERINVLMRENYDWLKKAFRQAGLDFVYLPMFFKDEDIKEKVLYYAPYLSEEVLRQTEFHNSFLLNYMRNPGNREKILPSFLYSPIEVDDDWIFSGLTLEIKVEDEDSLMQYFSHVISEIEKGPTSVPRYMKCKDNENSNVRFSLGGDDVKFSLGGDDDVPTKEKADYSSQKDDTAPGSYWKKFVKYFKKKPYATKAEKEEGNEFSEPGLDEICEEDVEDILASLAKNIERLLLIGVPLGAIHEFISSQETISRLCITDDLRIILPDYNNKEVKMTAQYKAVYLLFLYHPEGIILKHLEEYHNELVYFYKKTSKVEKLSPKMLESIKKLERIGNNYLNTTLAKIRAAFVESFDKHLARHYIIQGKPGGPYRIPLDPKLLIFEEDEA